MLVKRTSVPRSASDTGATTGSGWCQPAAFRIGATSSRRRGAGGSSTTLVADALGHPTPLLHRRRRRARAHPAGRARRRRLQARDHERIDVRVDQHAARKDLERAAERREHRVVVQGGRRRARLRSGKLRPGREWKRAAGRPDRRERGQKRRVKVRAHGDRGRDRRLRRPSGRSFGASTKPTGTTPPSPRRLAAVPQRRAPMRPPRCGSPPGRAPGAGSGSRRSP